MAPRSAMAVVAALAAAATLATAGAEASAGVPALRPRQLKSKRVKAFGQCAGDGMEEAQCQVGCLCFQKNEYFSGCKPAPGSPTSCDLTAAKDYVHSLKRQAAPMDKDVERTAHNKAAKIKAYNEAVVEASKAMHAAAAAMSRQQVLADAATMKAVQHDNEGKVHDEEVAVKEAKEHLEHTKKVAEKEAQVQVTKAEEALKKAKAHLEEVKKVAAKRVEDTIAAEDDNVKKAKEEQKKTTSTALGPVLEKRKQKKAEAAKKAVETAEAQKKAEKAKADALEAKNKAAKDAEAAAKAAREPLDLVKKWKAAVS